MPISFEPQGPYNPAVSSAYGAAQEYDRLAPLLQQHALANQQMQFQAQQAQAHLAAQAVQGAADRQAQADMQAKQLSQRRQEFMASQGVSPRETFQAQAALDQQREHAELQNWLQQREFSNADDMQLRKYNQGVSAVQEGLANGTLTQEQANAALFQLKTHIDPLEMKQKASQQKHLDLQNNMLNQQAAQQALHQEVYKKVVSGNAEQVKVPVRDEQGRVVAYLYPQADGKYHEVKIDAGKEKPVTSPEGLKATDYLKAFHDVVTGIDKKVMAKDDMGRPQFPDLHTAEGRAEAIRSELAARGLAPTLQEHFARQQQQQAAPPPQQQGGGRLPGFLDQFVPRPPQPQPAPPPPRPFDPSKPETLGPDERRAVETFDALRRKAGEARLGGRLTDTEQIKVLGDVTRAKHLLASHGSTAAMSPAVLAEYRGLLESVQTALAG